MLQGMDGGSKSKGDAGRNVRCSNARQDRECRVVNGLKSYDWLVPLDAGWTSDWKDVRIKKKAISAMEDNSV